MVLKGLFYTVILMIFLLLGCNKKKSEDTLAELNIEKDAIESVVEEEESDAIFDEFYEEGEPAKKEEQSAVKKSTERRPAKKAVEFDPNGRYSVQVSCVASQTLAKKIMNKLEKRGYPAYIAEVNNPTPDLHGLYHRIRIGGFSSIVSAKQFGETNLLDEGYTYWVDNKSNDNIGLSGEGLGTSTSSNEYEMTDSPPTTETLPPPEEKKNDFLGNQKDLSPASTDSLPSTVQSLPPQETYQSEISNPAKASTQSEDKEVVPESATPTVSNESEMSPSPSPPVSSPANIPTPKKVVPENDDDEWGDLDEEWGSDTSDW